MTRRAWWILAIGAGLIVGAWRWPAAPGGFAAPPEWATLFAELERCSGLHRSYNAIEWEIRDSAVQLPSGLLEVGQWDAPGHIWIIRDRLDDPGTVKHEMLHYLLGRPGHFVPPFEVCAPL